MPSNWIKTKRTNPFQSFARPDYINFYKEVVRIITTLGGTPGLVASVNGMIGAVTIDKGDVGLGNVDNTADINKPISTLQQAALDLKQDKYLTVVEYTINHVLNLTDISKLVLMNVGSANTLTVPANTTHAFPIGTQILVAQKGLGQTTITPALGVTVNVSDARYKLLTQFAMSTLIKVGTDEWYLSGDLTA